MTIVPEHDFRLPPLTAWPGFDPRDSISESITIDPFSGLIRPAGTDASGGDVQRAFEKRAAAEAIATGWICPKCGRGVRPDLKSCDHGAWT